MTATTAGMVVVTVALTIFAGPLFDVCMRIGDALTQPIHLVTASAASDGAGS